MTKVKQAGLFFSNGRGKCTRENISNKSSSQGEPEVNRATTDEMRSVSNTT
jgi:hypothetical protein